MPDSVGNYAWHTDKSYHAAPSLMTMLHALELPPRGGDTEFANTAAGYAALPEATKREVADLKVEHSWEASRRNLGAGPITEEQKQERPPVTHPLVRTHPDTGVKSLYLGLHTSHVLGMPPAEGRALLDRLLAHTTQPRVRLRASVAAGRSRHVGQPLPAAPRVPELRDGDAPAHPPAHGGERDGAVLGDGRQEVRDGDARGRCRGRRHDRGRLEDFDQSIDCAILGIGCRLRITMHFEHAIRPDSRSSTPGGERAHRVPS